MRIDRQRRGMIAAASSLATGARPLPEAVAADDIVIGQVGPFTGTPVPAAPEIHAGIQAALAHLNASGGVLGRRLALFQLDDGFKADGFARQFAEALKRKPVALLSPVGTDSLQRLLDDKLLDSADLVVLNAVPGAEHLRQPGHARLFHLRAGDRQQVERIVRHAITLGVKAMAVVHQQVSMATSGLAAARQLSATLGLAIEAIAAPADGASLAEVARRTAASPTQGVLVLGSPRFGAECIVALRQAGLVHAVYALSYVSPALIGRLAGSLGSPMPRGVGLAQVFPNPNGSRSALQSAFQRAMERQGVPGPYSAFQLEGYITARVLAEGLRRGGEATPAALARGLRAMGDLDLGGFRVRFDAGNVGSRFVDIAVVGDDGRLLY